MKRNVFLVFCNTQFCGVSVTPINTAKQFREVKPNREVSNEDSFSCRSQVVSKRELENILQGDLSDSEFNRESGFFKET